MANQINPNKLHLSKWTAISPEHKEKHFIVTDLLRDENEDVVDVTLQAVLTKRDVTLHWRQLKDDSVWLTGWR